MLDGLVMLEKDVVDVRVDRPEIALEVGSSVATCLGNGEQATDDIPDPVLLSRAKEPGNDPTCIRQQLNRQAFLHAHS